MSLNENEETITSQNFDFLKKISKIKTIYLRAFQKSLCNELDKDLPLLFKNGDQELFKDIKQILIKYLSRYMDDKFISIIDAQDMQEKLLAYYKLDSSYQNKSIKFALLSADEELNLKEEAINILKQKKESMNDLLISTNRLKENKYDQLNKIFDEITMNICKYDSISSKEFNKDEKMFN